LFRRIKPSWASEGLEPVKPGSLTLSVREKFFGKSGFKIFKTLSRAVWASKSAPFSSFIPLQSWYVIAPAERVAGRERVYIYNV